jgi:hypothetical protein
MSAAQLPKTHFFPKDIAARYGVGIDRVLSWIRDRDLVALNLAKRAESKRPRYVVTLEALLDFEQRRAMVPPARALRRKRHRREGVTEYF